MNDTEFYNELYSMSQVMGYTRSDIARITGRSVNTVYKWLSSNKKLRTSPSKNQRSRIINKLQQDAPAPPQGALKSSALVTDSLDAMFHYSLGFIGLNNRIKWAYKKNNTTECVKTLAALASVLQAVLSDKGYPFDLVITQDHEPVLSLCTRINRYEIILRRSKALVFAILQVKGTTVERSNERRLLCGTVDDDFVEQIGFYLN